MPSESNCRILSPLGLDKRRTEALIAFLDANEAIPFFDNHTVWSSPVFGDFRLTHNILRRPRKLRPDGVKPGLRYEILSNRLLGEGSCSQVYLSRATLVSDENRRFLRTKPAGHERVVKWQRLDEDDTGHLDMISHGHACAMRIEHLHAKPAVLDGTQRFEVERRLPGVELYYLLQDDEDAPMDTLTRLRLTFAVLQAYRDQVARYGFVHRDIKIENILVHMPPAGSLLPIEARVIDYGFCMEDDHEDEQIAGSPPYCAPEIWDGRRPTPKSDIFSLGRVLAGIWRDAHPIWNEDNNAAFRAFASEVCHDQLFADMDFLRENTRIAIRNQLTAMTRPVADTRPSIDEVITAFTLIANDYYLNGRGSPGIPATRALRAKSRELEHRHHGHLARTLHELAERTELTWLQNSPAPACENLHTQIQAMTKSLRKPRTHADKALTVLGNTGILAGGLGVIGACGLAVTRNQRGSFFWRPQTDTAHIVNTLDAQLRMCAPGA